MSLAGKILSGLIVLMAVVWVMLASAVTQLNKNGGQALESLRTQVAKVEADVVKAQQDLQALKDETHRQQLVTQDELSVFEARRSDLEKARAENLEIASRVRYQLQGIEANVKAAQALDEERLAEKKAETKGKADAEAEVERLKGERTELVNRLTSLREKFRQSLQENKAMVERLNKAKADDRPARKASFAR